MKFLSCVAYKKTAVKSNRRTESVVLSYGCAVLTVLHVCKVLVAIIYIDDCVCTLLF